MKISVHKLRNDPLFIELTPETAWCQAVVTRATEDFRDKESPYPFSGSLRIQRTLDQIDLSGNLAITLTTTCDRCAESYTHALDIPLRVTFIPSSVLHETDDTDTEDDSEGEGLHVWTYDQDEIDLSNVLYESLILAQPTRFLCADDCRGLCATCGSNLNLTDCTCRADAIDPRFSLLKTWKPVRK